MKAVSTKRGLSFRYPLFVGLCLLLHFGNALGKDLVIGVLAYEGRLQAQQRWQPTADYLSDQLAPHRFSILALTHKEFEHAINKGRLDFILTNPGHYALLQVRYGAARIATFVANFRDTPLTHFSSVIFTRRDSGITDPQDLRGHKLAAVSEDAFGGYQLARRTLLQQGIDTQSDLQLMWLGFPHSDVVKAVLDGKADAGVVRSGVLEGMADKGQLNLNQIRVIAPRKDDSLPLLHSTGIYPEWPFARLPDTDIDLSRQVALSLMRMPARHPAAVRAAGAGWTIPLSDAKVHAVLKELKVTPYVPAPLTLTRVVNEYGHWLSIIGLLLLIALAAAMRLVATNRRLQHTQGLLQKSQGELEEAVRRRSAELDRTRHALEDAQGEHQQAKLDADNTCSAMQTLHEILLREGLSAQNRIDAMVESVRQHLGADIGLLSRVQDDQYETCSISPASAEHTAPLYSAGVSEAIELRHIHQSAENPGWAYHIACPVFVHGELHCLLEFAAHTESGVEHPTPSAMGLALLALTAQWITHEILQREHQAQESARTEAVRQRFQTITRREKDVLGLLVKGDSNKIIARHLNLSPKTVEMHRASLIRKTGAKSSTELVQLAVKSDLF